jgi:hypothetical protein
MIAAGGRPDLTAPGIALNKIAQSKQQMLSPKDTHLREHLLSRGFYTKNAPYARPSESRKAVLCGENDVLTDKRILTKQDILSGLSLYLHDSCLPLSVALPESRLSPFPCSPPGI